MSNFEVNVGPDKFAKVGYQLEIRRESHSWATGELTFPQLIHIRNTLTEFIDQKVLEHWPTLDETEAEDRSAGRINENQVTEYRKRIRGKQ